MKTHFHTGILFALLAAVAPLMCHAQTNFFYDNFTGGSTIDSTPAPPTTNSASYETIAGKIWAPTPTLASQGGLRFGIASSSGGDAEIQALFATNPVVLTAPGDFIQLTVVFTNVAGPLTTGNSFMGFGLYDTGGSTNYPAAGGMDGPATSAFTTTNTGAAQPWQGYVGSVGYSGQSSEIMTRPIQNQGSLANNDQDLVTEGSTTFSYSFPARTVIGSTLASTVILTAGGTYTEVLNITLNATASLAITNTLYSGPTTNGTVLTQFGAVATNTTYLTGSFNGLAMGFYEKTSGPSNVLDIASILVSGQSTIVTTAPTITSQPSAVLVTTNGSCAFSVAAQGFNVTYQWQRNGTNLVDGGNISGATSDLLITSPATVTDELSQADGYSVVVAGAGNFSTNSVTNSLTLVASTNLIWTDNSSSVWDVNNSVNWEDTNQTQTVFNFGDPVTFNDVGLGGNVDLDNTYLSAASVTVDALNVNNPYVFSSLSTGGFAGPGGLYYVGAAELTIDNANTYAGGTLISNATAHLILQNLAGLGSGPVTLGKAGGELEMVPAGSASSGIAGNVVVADDFTILVDATNNSFSGVFLGDFSGISGKTLTITNGTTDTGGFYRVRVYGNNTVYDANLNLANSAILFASYASANSQTYDGVISGPGAFIEKGTITYFNGANTYSGGTYPAQGAIGLGVSSVGSPGSLVSGPIGTGPLLLMPDSATSLTGIGGVFASSGSVTDGNAIEYPSGTNNLTLMFGGTHSLTLTGPFTLNGNDGLKTNTITSRSIEVTNTALTAIDGVISDGGLGYGLNISSNGTLAFNNTETYAGPTTVSNATLLVNGQIGSGALTVATNATIGGDGIITGPVTILNSGTLAPGNQAIGTLAISNTLTFQGGSKSVILIDETAGMQDLVKGVTTANYNGTLAATNLAGALSAGNSFTVFSAGAFTGNFTNIVGSPGPGLAWSFDPTNGVLSVITGVATNPTNITFSVSGGNLNLSWPANHLGWFLQVQTNSVAHGIGTNWVTVPNSGTVDSASFPIVPANGTVFYRLMYP